MTDKEKLDAIRAEINRLVEVRGYSKEMANDLFTFMDSLPNEPVSEDLEKAVDIYINQPSSCLEYCDNGWEDKTDWQYVEKAFKAGAQWKEQQMMEDAKIYEVESHYDKCIGKYLSPDITLNEHIFKIGDKVKILVIKQE